jgi:hypothetical protein
MADSADLGATDADGALFGYEGLYSFGSAIIPSSLGVNPSLTIAAVAERCAERLVARGRDLGLPVGDVTPGVPAERVGERVIPPPLRKNRRRGSTRRTHRRRRLSRAQRRHTRRRPAS